MESSGSLVCKGTELPSSNRWKTPYNVESVCNSKLKMSIAPHTKSFPHKKPYRPLRVNLQQSKGIWSYSQRQRRHGKKNWIHYANEWRDSSNCCILGCLCFFLIYSIDLQSKQKKLAKQFGTTWVNQGNLNTICIYYCKLWGTHRSVINEEQVFQVKNIYF